MYKTLLNETKRVLVAHELTDDRQSTEHKFAGLNIATHRPFLKFDALTVWVLETLKAKSLFL